MTTKELNKIYKTSKVFNSDCIKDEIKNRLSEYTLESEEKKNKCTVFYFNKNESEKIKLIINSSLLLLSLTWCSDNVIREIIIDNNLLMKEQILERREKGFIFSVIRKKFDKTSFHKNKVTLVYISENEYAFSNEIFGNIKLENYDLKELLMKFKLYDKNDIERLCDLKTRFEARMKDYEPFNGLKSNGKCITTKILLNGEDISKLYEGIKGVNQLYRIYDLYNGIINPRDEEDIKDINFGLAYKESFNLKSLKGISSEEEKLTGKSLIPVPNEYLNYIKTFLYREFGYDKEVHLDRESLLKGITYQIPKNAKGKQFIKTKY